MFPENNKEINELPRREHLQIVFDDVETFHDNFAVPKELQEPQTASYYNQPYMYQRHEQTREPKKSTGGVGKFFRTLCLIVICATVSALAAYGVIEFRYLRGDFNFTEQPEQALTRETPQHNETITPEVERLIITENLHAGFMAAEDIYDMALSQVVGIRTDLPTSSRFGNTAATTPLSGSGFVISSDGYILTNHHVIEIGYTSRLPIVVTFNEGEEFEAEVIGFDSFNDVALLKIDAQGLNPVYIGNSDNIRVGQRIYVVGNPLGDLVYTMTDGIVSALDRVVTVDRNILNAFQLSAAVNQGNSGGPVYNTNGEVIGIVTAKMGRGSIEGIGFAIPINDAIEIAKELIEYGFISDRVLLGISTQTVNYDTMITGSLVLAVTPDSAADKAGIKVGDVIIQLDDTEVTSLESLRFELRRFDAGDTTTITVWREGARVELTITFEEDLQA